MLVHTNYSQKNASIVNLDRSYYEHFYTIKNMLNHADRTLNRATSYNSQQESALFSNQISLNIKAILVSIASKVCYLIGQLEALGRVTFSLLVKRNKR